MHIDLKDSPTNHTGTPVNLRVLEVEPEMNDKIRSLVPPIINFHQDMTEMIWENSNPKYLDAFEFQW